MAAVSSSPPLWAVCGHWAVSWRHQQRPLPPPPPLPLPLPTLLTAPDWDVSLIAPRDSVFTIRMGCGVQTERAKISCLRLLVGSFNFLLGVRELLITFHHLYRQSHLAIIAGISPPDILMNTQQTCIKHFCWQGLKLTN